MRIVATLILSALTLYMGTVYSGMLGYTPE